MKSGSKRKWEAGKIGVKQNTFFLLQAYNVAHYIDRKQSQEEAVAKVLHASGEAASRDKRGRKPEKKKSSQSLIVT